MSSNTTSTGRTRKLWPRKTLGLSPRLTRPCMSQWNLCQPCAGFWPNAARVDSRFTQLEGHVQKFGGRCALEPLSEDLPCQRLDLGHRLGPILAIAHHTWQRVHFGEPATVVLAFEFDRERHGPNVASPGAQRRPASRSMTPPGRVRRQRTDPARIVTVESDRPPKRPVPVLFLCERSQRAAARARQARCEARQILVGARSARVQLWFRCHGAQSSRGNRSCERIRTPEGVA